jgi:aminoglycoside 3-N-acetyltransferase
MSAWAPAELKRKAKSRWKSLRIAVEQKSRGFSQQDFTDMLRRLGVTAGDSILVHSSLDQFAGFLGKPADIIAALQDAVSASGTVLMPTLPFRGSALDYVQKGQVFDVRRTPSQMGLLTELFRRLPGVIRSVHPTHPTAAWGGKSAEFVLDHYRAETPCGRDTPYGRLLQFSGKILFLGTDITTMTFFHTVEEILEPQMPFSPFTKDSFTIQSIDSEGKPVTTRTRLFDPQCSRKRNIGKLTPALKKANHWKENRLGSLKCILLEASHVLDACTTLAQQGIFCYDL